jgi:hypothetical protein
MNKLIALLAMASLSATPAAASVRDAAFSSSADPAQVRTGVFVGAHYRLSFHRDASAPQGRASFKLSGMAHTPGASDLKLGSGLEIAGGKSGKPALFVAGRDADKLGDQARLGSGGTIALVVVGLVVVAGSVAALAIDDRLDRQNSE